MTNSHLVTNVLFKLSIHITPEVMAVLFLSIFTARPHMQTGFF